MPKYQLTNSADLLIDVLEVFLREAHKRTYADIRASKAESLRPGSYDYHFSSGDLTYHDTYFGSTKFIGEEIIYKKDKPVWGMNYYGTTLDNEIDESFIDALLRPALLAGVNEKIPLRGPATMQKKQWKYTFRVKGSLKSFIGIEEISLSGEAVYRLHCHGGFIE